MTAPCFYHPDRIAVYTCAQCGLPICVECMDRVGERTVCHQCVQAVRSKLEAQMGIGGTGANVGGPPNRDGGAFGGNAVVLPPVTLGPERWLIGIGLGLLIAIAGSVGVEKFEMNLHLGLSLLYVLVGYAVGWGVLKGVGRGSGQIAAIAVVLYLIGIGAGILAEAGDVLRMAGGGAMADAVPFVLHHEDALHWVFVAFGIYGCYRYVMRRG